VTSVNTPSLSVYPAGQLGYHAFVVTTQPAGQQPAPRRGLLAADSALLGDDADRDLIAAASADP
jgi:hypothetical protein